jgi:hypothetical protein
MFGKYNISIMNNAWEMIIPRLKVKHIPRNGELIYLNDLEQYYRVLNVIHNITKKQEIFVIVENYDKKN